MAKTDWIETRCSQCETRTVIHKDWINPNPDCGVCKLISGKFVDAIEILLISRTLEASEGIKNNFRDLIKTANKRYNEKLREGVERDLAWRAAERELANHVWNNKELRKYVLAAMKELRRYEKEDAKAKYRNEQRAARTDARTRRWSG